MIAPKVAIAMPPSEKSPEVSVRSPAPIVSAAATVTRLRVTPKSTLFWTQMRAPVAAMRPNRTIARPPRTQDGMVCTSSLNLGHRPSRIATTAAMMKTRLEYILVTAMTPMYSGEEDRQAAKDAGWDGVHEFVELRAQAQQDRDDRRDDEDQARVHPGYGHDADL